MIDLNKPGHLFYGLGIIAYGIQQIIIRDFRPQILPGFPAWVHEYSIFAIVTGVAMIIVGLIISGIFKVTDDNKKKISLYLGFYFLALIIVSHIPYLLFVYPHKLSHLGSWGNVLKGLAFSGGAFVMAGSFLNNSSTPNQNNLFVSVLEKLVPIGRIFFCTTIILFGCNHFVYDISTMVPKWLGTGVFWSYFGGAALILSGTAILFKILLNPVALLLALMLFLWFIFLHAPNAIANPYVGRGNQIVSAFDALLFAELPWYSPSQKNKQSTRFLKIFGQVMPKEELKWRFDNLASIHVVTLVEMQKNRSPGVGKNILYEINLGSQMTKRYLYNSNTTEVTCKNQYGVKQFQMI